MGKYKKKKQKYGENMKRKRGGSKWENASRKRERIWEKYIRKAKKQGQQKREKIGSKNETKEKVKKRQGTRKKEKYEENEKKEIEKEGKE